MTDIQVELYARATVFLRTAISGIIANRRSYLATRAIAIQECREALTTAM